MHTALLILASLIPVPEPAAFSLEVDASRHSEYSITLNGQALRPGLNYVTEPLYGPATVEIEVRWTDGDEQVRRTFTVTLEPGYRHTLRIYIPRVYPTTVLV